MAELVLTDASVVVNSVDLSDHVTSVTINYGAELPEKTAMGDTSRTRLGGLLDWSLDLEFNQDFAASNVDVTLFALVGVSTTVTIKPTSGAVAATNPSYSGTCFLESYTPIGNAVGEVAKAPATFQGSGTLTRATS